MSRRSFLGAAGSLGLLALVPSRKLDALMAAASPGQAGRFLNAHEMDVLRAVTARLVPGPPEDPDPGALDAKAAEAIDLLLGAFEIPGPPMIHAGGPFSNRAGSRHDDFADFVPLDPHAELGWRIRLEGSRGRPEREFAGPVRGLQEVYREGLAHLDARAGGAFAALPGPAQDLILSDQSDDQVQELVGVAFSNTLEAMYGPPEYGGNRNLVGWGFTHWDGDTQPRGHTDAEVSQPGARAAAARLSAKQLAGIERFMPALARRGLRWR